MTSQYPYLNIDPKINIKLTYFFMDFNEICCKNSPM